MTAYLFIYRSSICALLHLQNDTIIKFFQVRGLLKLIYGSNIVLHIQRNKWYIIFLLQKISYNKVLKKIYQLSHHKQNYQKLCMFFTTKGYRQAYPAHGCHLMLVKPEAIHKSCKIPRHWTNSWRCKVSWGVF